MHELNTHEMLELAAATIIALAAFVFKRQVNSTDERLRDLERKHDAILEVLNEVRSNTQSNRVILEVVKRKLDL